MRSNRWYVGCAVVSAVILSGLAAVPAGAAPPPYQIFINGDATFSPYDTGIYVGTTILIPFQVQCPVGASGQVHFAGLPGYFSDGRFAQPYLPGNTMPYIATCDGQLHQGYATARSIYRLQDPSTNPFQYFTSGPVTATVALATSSAPGPVTDTQAINILPPPGSDIVIHTDTAPLVLNGGDPYFRTTIGVSWSYRCSPPWDGRIGSVNPVAQSNPTFRISCDDTWRTISGAGGGISASLAAGFVVFTVDVAGRTERKTITVTPALPDAVASMSLSNSTAHTMDVAWSAPPPRISGTAGPVPDTSITGYKVGWIEANTGRGWETTSPHWPLSYSPVTLTGLIPDTLYTVWVIPVNVSGDGPATTRTYSTTQDVAAPPPVPPATPPVVGPPPAIVAPPVAPPSPPIFATQTATPLVAVVAPPVLPAVAVLPSVIIRIPSRISIVATKRVRRGGAAGFSGLVTTYRGGKFVRASGLRVVLQRLAGKKWVNVALSTSKGASARRLHGSVNLNLRPARTTTYRWVFAGNGTVAPSISKTVMVTVLR
jgi:hypothetical protein